MDLLKPLKQILQREIGVGCLKPGSNLGSELQVLKEVLWVLWGKLTPQSEIMVNRINRPTTVKYFGP